MLWRRNGVKKFILLYLGSYVYSSLILLPLLAAFVVVAPDVRAQALDGLDHQIVYTGKGLLIQCQAYLDSIADAHSFESLAIPDQTVRLAEIAFCLGEVSGVERSLENIGLIAPPESISVKDFAAVVVDYLKAHPSETGSNASDVIALALIKKYPGTKKSLKILSGICGANTPATK